MCSISLEVRWIVINLWRQLINCEQNISNDLLIKPCTLGWLLYKEFLLIPTSRENSKEPVAAIMKRF